MKKISIFILFLIGINCKFLTLREDNEDIHSNKILITKYTHEKEKMDNTLANNQKINEEFDEDEIMENFNQIDVNNFYEIVIADMIIELIELNYESCINNNNKFDDNLCHDSFIKLNETIKLKENFCESFQTTINRNANQYKQLLSKDLLNSLPQNIEIQKDGQLGPDGEFNIDGEYGPNGKKGPLGPYGRKGVKKHHHHKHSQYGKLGRIFCQHKKECKESKSNWKNWKNKGPHYYRRLVDAVIDKHAICEYIYGFFGFDVNQCYE